MTLIRNFRWDDLPAIVDFSNRHAEAIGQSGRFTLEQIEPSWRAPYNHPETDCFLAHDENGILVGYAILDRGGDDPHALGVFRVMPAHSASGTGLIDAVSSLFQRITDQRPLQIDWMTPDQDTDAAALFESHGFPLVRRFYTMRITFDSPITDTTIPAGISFKPYAPDLLESLHQVYAEVFQDHWNPTIFPIEEWRADTARESFDPSLWWIAYDGVQIAGFLCSHPVSETGAYVGLLGVRRAWRKRGLAYTLLRNCFAEYQKRGFQWVDLGVDSDSPTNAVALYERAGMRPRQTTLYFRQSLEG